MNRCVVLGMLTVLVTTTQAAELPRVDPAAAGLSGEKLAELKPAFLKLVDTGRLAGGVALVARHGQVVYLEPFGYRDLESKAPMTEDTIFAIASMTKPVTCVAAMTLVEEGKLGLDDPVARYLPELGALRVLGAAQDDRPDEPETVPARRPITVRDLMAHASGLAYGALLTPNARIRAAYERAGVHARSHKTMADQVATLAKVPLAHQPGEGWTYGVSHDVLGRVIEIVSGKTLDRCLRERIFAPLDMRDTGFFVPEAKRGRVATVYRARLLGGLEPLPRNYGSATFFSGGGGLFSTVRDYARFAQMLAGGGSLEDVRMLKPETIALMTTNQIGAHRALGVFKYGLGFGLELGGRHGDQASLQRYFWGGITSTYFWVDPHHDLVAVILTQVLPTGSSGAEMQFRRIVDAALGE